MSYFLKSVGDTGFIQMLRSQMKPEDLEEFDKMVKDKLQEYDELWMKIEPTITNMNRGEYLRYDLGLSKLVVPPTNRKTL